MLDPGVDASYEGSVGDPADEIPGVEVTAGNVSEDYYVRYPIVEIPRVDVKLGDAEFTGVDKDFDAKSTGVEVDAGAYGETYDAVPQEQGNKIEVYDLGQQGMVFVENKLVMLTGTIVVHKSMKALPIKTGGADTELAVNNETLHCQEVTVKQKEQVLDTVDKRPDQRLRVDVRLHVVEHKREGNTEAHKVIGGKEQRDHVTGGDFNSPMVSEEEGMPTCVTNAQEHGDMAVAREHGDVAVASIPNTCVQGVTSNDPKTYLSSETEGCNKKCVRSEAMRPCDGPKHNNISVIYGTEASKFILGTDKRVSVGCKIPGVSLGYNKIRGVKVVVNCKIPGVKLGYEKYNK